MSVGLLAAVLVISFIIITAVTATPTPISLSATTVTAGEDSILKLTVLPAEASDLKSNPITTAITTSSLATTAVTGNPITAVVTTVENPEPTPVPTSTPFPPVTSIPTAITISTINLVNSPIETVGMEKVKTNDGKTLLRWQARDKGVGYQPTEEGEVCHWGLVTLNGHNWFQLRPAIFINLYKVKPEETITLTSSSGETCDYQVEWMKQYGPLDTSWLYQPDLDPHYAYLNIYTCSVDFKERYVVRAKRAIN